MIQHTGSAELTIEGKNLKDTLRLLHDGTEYTPLASTEDSVTFILGDNGTNRIYVNGEYFFGVQISDIVIPDILPTIFSATQREALWSANYINQTNFNGNCINYTHLFDENFPYFTFRVGTSERPVTSADGFEGVNCSLVSRYGPSENTYFIAASEIQDITKPAFITYQGFIIAVFNYE